MTADRLMRCGRDFEEYQVAFERSTYASLDYDEPMFRRSDHRILGVDYDPHPGIADSLLAWLGWRPMETYSSAHAPDSMAYAFARRLREAGEYDQAVIEFMRVIEYYPGSMLTTDCLREICVSYYLDSRFEKCIRVIEELTGCSSGDAEALHVLRGLALYRLQRYAEAAEEFLAAVAAPSRDDEFIACRAWMLRGLSLAYDREWEAARRAFLRCPGHSPFRSRAVYAGELCVEGRSMKRKNPALAGTLAVVPGLGYLYAGYEATAVSAFLINGLMIWGVIESVEHGHDAVAATLGVVGFGWYAGNIYGSVSSARRKNLKMEEDLLMKFELGFAF